MLLFARLTKLFYQQARSCRQLSSVVVVVVVVADVVAVVAVVVVGYLQLASDGWKLPQRA